MPDFGRFIQFRYRRFFLPAFVFCLLVWPETREMTTHVLADAFLQVSAFVAATLAFYYGLKSFFPQQLAGEWISKRPWVELCYAALLGALPGCGGAIIIVTQYTKRQVSFGAVVAVLTATMGDAAFVLLAQEPISGLQIIAMGMVVGVLSGAVVNRIHDRHYLAPEYQAQATCDEDSTPSLMNKAASLFWMFAFFPALTLAVYGAFQIDPEVLLGLSQNTVTLFGATSAMIVLVIWALSSTGTNYQEVTSEDPATQDMKWINKVASDTNFVTAWVIAAFLLFELSVLWFNLDLGSMFQSYGPFMPLFGLLIGLLPGCGPQILVTGMYLQGVVPFSAQISNSISNDGDALFPAIALAPKAAMVATLYSAIPAFICGYGYYFLFEM